MRAPNPLRQRGAAREVPQYVVGTTWRYRGFHIDITDVDPTGQNRPGWWGRIDYAPDQSGTDVRAMLRSVAGDPGDFAVGPAPDPHAAMRHAVHTIDAQHKLGATAQAENRYFTDTDLHRGVMAVVVAIRDLQRDGEPLTRGSVTRRIEEIRRAMAAAPNRSAVPDADEAVKVDAFMRLPLSDRIELVDELLEVADAYGGRWPNPKPDAHLLELHITLLERQLAQLVDECRRLANPPADAKHVRAELAECSEILRKVRAAVSEREGWRTVPAHVAARLHEPEGLARYAAQWSAERERAATIMLRNARVLGPHEALVWHDFRVGLVDDGNRLQVKFKPKAEGPLLEPLRASKKQLRRALEAVENGEFAEDALRDQGVDMAGVEEATILEYEDEAGDHQVRAFGATA